jgi:hypothetical protein
MVVPKSVVGPLGAIERAYRAQLLKYLAVFHGIKRCSLSNSPPPCRRLDLFVAPCQY